MKPRSMECKRNFYCKLVKGIKRIQTISSFKPEQPKADFILNDRS